MKKSKKVVIGCSIISAVCFGIVSYGRFYRGRMELGWTFAVLTAVQLVLAAGFGYGTVLGLVRLKAKNCYATMLLHGVLNIFMV